jgi:radical SAM protein with 4Fe4S-binding SPASM domain
MLKSEWNDSDEETNFWMDNESAIGRRVQLKRIFIVNKKEAHRLKTNSQIRKHMNLQERSNYILSSVIEKDTLETQSPYLLQQAGNGFILVNSRKDKIALLDEIDTKRRAKPVTDEEHLKSLLSTFNGIWELSSPLKEYLDAIPWSHYKKEMISIFVTTKCNLNCDYCFTNKSHDKHIGQTIPLEFAKKGIDDYFSDSNNYMRHVRFFGAGEPTDEFDLMKKIYQHAINKGGASVTFEIQTNGAFSDAVAKWIKKNIHIVWISCDGTPEIQDKHRPFKIGNRKSSEVIEKNIRILLERDSNAFVGIRATITDENIQKQTELIDYFHKQGITDIWVDPIFPSVGDKPVDNENPFNMKLFTDEFLNATKYAHEKGVFYGSILTCNFNDSVDKHCRACLPAPHLTTDGFVSACDMALFGNDENHMSKEFIYGQWDEKNNTITYVSNVIKRLQSRTTENMKHCELCSSKEHCGGYCLGEVLNETGDMFGQKREVCRAIQRLDCEMADELRPYKYTHP